MKKYHFTYTEYFNNTKITHTEWESDGNSDYSAMVRYFNTLVRSLRREGIVAMPIRDGGIVDGYITETCGIFANSGIPSEGDTIEKKLTMTYTK